VRRAAATSNDRRVPEASPTVSLGRPQPDHHSSNGSSGQCNSRHQDVRYKGSGHATVHAGGIAVVGVGPGDSVSF
jgi:hypothetical protein